MNQITSASLELHANLSEKDHSDLVQLAFRQEEELRHLRELHRQMQEVYIYRTAELEILQNFLTFSVNEKKLSRFRENGPPMIKKRYVELSDQGDLPPLPLLPVKEDMYA